MHSTQNVFAFEATSSNSLIQQRLRSDLGSSLVPLFSKEIFNYLKEKALDLAFFLIPAKTIHSSPGPVLPPTEGLAQSSIPWLDRGSSAGPLPRPAFAALSACLRNIRHQQTSVVAKVYGAARWPGFPLSLMPCLQSTGPKSGKGVWVPTGIWFPAR